MKSGWKCRQDKDSRAPCTPVWLRVWLHKPEQKVGGDRGDQRSEVKEEVWAQPKLGDMGAAGQHGRR